MAFVNPFLRPQEFNRQVDALFRASLANQADPIPQIDAHVEASFEAVLAGVRQEPEPRAARPVASAPVSLAYVPQIPSPLFAPDASSPVASVASPVQMGAPLSPPSVLSNRMDWAPLVQEMAQKHNVPEWLLGRVIRAESGGDPLAVSQAGAMGLMQLMPETARELGVSEPFDARQNVEGGARYLRRLLDMFSGDYEKAVAAYNAGPGNVAHYGGVPPFAETESYVKRVLGDS